MLLFQTVSSINVFAFPVSCFLLARLLNCEPLSRDAISAQRRSHDLSPWKQHVSSARPPVLKLLFIYEGTKSCSLYSHMNSALSESFHLRVNMTKNWRVVVDVDCTMSWLQTNE